MEKKVTFGYSLLLFFLVSFLGWIWEVCLYLVREQRFVNRGILTGPWLPIYGAGALFLYFLLRRLPRKILPVFLVSMAVCSALEYGAGWALETMWGVRWWDYREMPWNLDGRICLLSCLLFGAGGVLLYFVLLPLSAAVYDKISVRTRRCIGIILLLLFIADAAYSADFPNVGADITYQK